MSKAQILNVDRPKEAAGWRSGKPVEDPAKTKRWGFVTAKPSEFLVHVRGGKVRARSSGQGSTCFKLPWDSVAIVPTSLQQLAFTADQVTREKVGIEVTGLAVYRIADPLMAYRVLNFSFPERAQEKLEETLTSMFVGAARRLIANLSVDDCLQKRKEALATELLREVAPVVGGTGRVDDDTDRGWGVVLDTIEIQQVRVLSDGVFAAMQAPFRATLDREAREAKAEAEKRIQTRDAECQRAIAEAKIAAELVVAEKQRERAEQQAELKRQAALREAATARELEEARLQGEAALKAKRAELVRIEAETRTADQVATLERARREAEAELAVYAVRAEAAQKRAALEQALVDAALLRRRGEADALRVEGEAKAAVALAAASADDVAAKAKSRVLMAEKLPELASAVGGKFGDVKVVQIGAGADGQSPFGHVAQAVAAVVEMVRGDA